MLDRAIFVWPWNENARTKQKQQTNGHKRTWLLVGQANAPVKKLHSLELSRYQSILRFHVILQHDWVIEECLLHIRVFFGLEKEESMFWSFHPFVDSLKQITKTDRNHYSRSYENFSIWNVIRAKIDLKSDECQRYYTNRSSGCLSFHWHLRILPNSFLNSSFIPA